MTLTVNDLPSQISDTDLRTLFSTYGVVQQLQLFSDRNSASVKLVNDKEEEAAFNDLNGKEWHGETLELELVFDDGRDPKDPPHTTSRHGS